MPPPEPKSSTVSPGCSCASAVGFPQPSDAATAFSGTPAICEESYKSLVIGSQQERSSAPPPHVATPPKAAFFAAAPYFCFTTSRKFSSLITVSVLANINAKFAQSIPAPPPGCVYSILHRESRALPAARPYL